MTESYAGRTVARVCFNGVDITQDLDAYLTKLTYTDSEGDETDDLQLELQDRDEVWLTQWLGELVNAAARTEPAATAQDATSGGTTTYRVTSSNGLNVRSGAGTGYSSIGVLGFGATVEVEAIEGGWAKLDWNGRTAYASAQYLQAAGSTVTQAVGSSEAVLGMSIRAALAAYSRDENGLTQSILDCGEFELDAVESSGPPGTVTIKATSLPYSSGMRKTKHSRTWKNYYLSGIAAELARGAGMTLLNLVHNDEYFTTVIQFRESNAAFLKRLCSLYGIDLKFTSGCIVLYNAASKEENAPIVIRNSEGKFTGRNFSTSRAETEYQSCRVSYTDPKTGKVISGTEYVADYDAGNKDNMQLEKTVKVASAAEAKRLAGFYLRRENRFARTAELSLPGDPRLLGGVAVALEGFGMWNGQCVIAKAAHTISRSGYTTDITVRRRTEEE